MTSFVNCPAGTQNSRNKCVHYFRFLPPFSLWKAAPRIDNPRWHSSNLLLESLRKPLVQFFQESGAFSRKHSLATSEPSSGRQKHEKQKCNISPRRPKPLGSSNGKIPSNVENTVASTFQHEDQIEHQTHRQGQDKGSSSNDHRFQTTFHTGPTGKDRRRSGEHSRPDLEQPTGIFHIRRSSSPSPSADPSISLISQPIDQPKDPTGPG